MREALLTHLPALRRYAHGLAGNREEAEDLLQGTLLRAVEHNRQWRGENGRSWLYAIMTNLNRNRLRTRARQPLLQPIDDELALSDDAPPPDPLLHNTLMRALDTLSPEARAILLLVAIEGCAYAEVAEVLDMPIGTVMSRLSRARRQLSELLARKSITSFSNR
ncbi:MAG: RNA polymerase sigma factor [Pelagibacterium sp.]|jgi:RNA polymerase sigma-70 factor (ECF subfamily)|uniref:RNA polymerase sigma factor n=1 Tax=Pelagibacterium sp. TaxID=1967288 RepID=UPI0032EFD1D4|tara:strand:- start:442 stop:933 length:492 start_codon:yes stop_codon:yes gene_type:complete